MANLKSIISPSPRHCSPRPTSPTAPATSTPATPWAARRRRRCRRRLRGAGRGWSWRTRGHHRQGRAGARQLEEFTTGQVSHIRLVHGFPPGAKEKQHDVCGDDLYVVAEFTSFGYSMCPSTRTCSMTAQQKQQIWKNRRERGHPGTVSFVGSVTRYVRHTTAHGIFSTVFHYSTMPLERNSGRSRKVRTRHAPGDTGALCPCRITKSQTSAATPAPPARARGGWGGCSRRAGR